MSVGTGSWPVVVHTSAPPLNVSGSHWIPLTSSLDHGSGGTGGNGGSSGGNGVDGDSPRYDRRKREDDTLYVILGTIVGTILIGVLVTLFVCARQQHKQRLLLGMLP